MITQALKLTLVLLEQPALFDDLMASFVSLPAADMTQLLRLLVLNESVRTHSLNGHFLSTSD